jgi:hypothetical protein
MQVPDSVRSLERDLRDIFGSRLRSIVSYGASDDGAPAGLRTLAVVDGLHPDDLRACAARVDAWHDQGLDTPLLLASEEFGRSLDAFPLEFGAILADHVLVAGADPFQGLTVDESHLRHACEIQARSHLLHLREGYLETRGRGDAIAALILASAPGFAALVRSVVRLQEPGADDARNRELTARRVEQGLGLPDGAVLEVVKLAGAASLSSDEARRVIPRYLDALERLTRYVDRWSPLPSVGTAAASRATP